MSVIMAVEKDGQIAVATDSLLTVGSSASPNLIALPKVVRVQDTCIGTSGFSAYYPLLDTFIANRDDLDLISEAGIQATFVSFWNYLRENFHFVNDQSDDDDITPFVDMRAEFLVAGRAGLFCVREILSVSRYRRFCAIGSGANHAEGAAQVLYDQDLPASVIARRAIEVACQFDRAAGGDVKVYELDER